MKSYHSAGSQTDPLGLVQSLKQKVSKTGTSTENTRVATSGSNRGASQPATNPVPTGGSSGPTSGASLVEHAEEHHKPSHVSLVGATHGERWCFPGVGKPPDFLIPVQAFLAEMVLAKFLVKLTRQ